MVENTNTILVRYWILVQKQKGDLLFNKSPFCNEK